MVQRRQRENDRAVVSPSPVGDAMVNDVHPSPPAAKPDTQRPFLTKMLQLQSRAIFDSARRS